MRSPTPREGRNRFSPPTPRDIPKRYDSHFHHQERRGSYTSHSSHEERNSPQYQDQDPDPRHKTYISKERLGPHRPLRSLSPHGLDNSQTDCRINRERSFIDSMEYTRHSQKPSRQNSKDEEAHYDERLAPNSYQGERCDSYMSLPSHDERQSPRHQHHCNNTHTSLGSQVHEERLHRHHSLHSSSPRGFDNSQSDCRINHDRCFIEATEYSRQFENPLKPPREDLKDGAQYDERLAPNSYQGERRDSHTSLPSYDPRESSQHQDHYRQRTYTSMGSQVNEERLHRHSQGFDKSQSDYRINCDRCFIEGTEYGRQYEDPQKPPRGNSKDEAQYDEMIAHRSSPLRDYRQKYSKREQVDGNATTTTSKYMWPFDPSLSRFSQGSKAMDGHQMYVQTSSHMDDMVAQTTFTCPPLNASPAKSSGIVAGDFLSSTLGDLSVGLYKDPRLLYRDHPTSTKFPSREYYTEKENVKYSPRNVFNTMMPSPQSKGLQSTSCTHQSKDLLGTSMNHLPSPSEEFHSCNLKFGAPKFETARDQQDVIYSFDSQNSTSMVDNCEYGCHVTEKMGNDDFGFGPDVIYRKMQPSSQGDYVSKVSTRTPSMGLDTNEVNEIKGSHRSFAKASLCDHQSLGEPDPKYLHIDRKLPTTRDVELPTTGSKYLEFGARVCMDHKSFHSKGGADFVSEAGAGSCKERLYPPRSKHDADMHRLDMSHQRSLTIVVDKYSALDRVQKRKHSMDVEISKHDARSTLPNSGDIYRQVYEFTDVNDNRVEEAPDALPSRKASVSPSHQYKKNKRPSDDRDSNRVYAAQTLSSHGQGFEIKGYVLDGQELSINKSLRPALVSLQGPNYQGKHDFLRPDKYGKRSVNHQHGKANAENGSVSESKMLSANGDPREDSEEFKQLVHKAFLRFSKHLNETSAQRRRYREQGKAGFLLCSVCASSNSKETRGFKDTSSLVLHTFSSLKVGLRADHLGLHKALCVLMGWNSDVGSSNAWVQKVLPDPEASALKEDLILWPPLVIIHNSTIGNKNEQKVVSIERMEAILRELGVGMTTAVCRGKPANQSIMVVKFKPTISGLKEAERLHKHYAENKRGRGELQQICSGISNKMESGGAQLDNLELVLYGYLGIADDLDKLEIETKKRCVVKSKKDIQIIAEAPLNAE